MLALGAELVHARARLVEAPDELHVGSANPGARPPPEVRGVEGREVRLAEVTEHGPHAERLDFIVGVPPIRKVREFGGIVPAAVAGRDLPRLESGVAERAVRLTHTTIRVAA